MTAKRNAYIPDGVERAVVLNDPAGAEEAADGFDRIYFGAEFCDRLLPSADELERMILAAPAAGKDMTFMTPLCSDLGLERLQKLLEIYPKHWEVTVNDWGALLLCRELGLMPSIGRLLAACCRDPRFELKVPENDPAFRDYVSASNLNSPDYIGFLSGAGALRFEIDNIIQSYNFAPGPEVRISLHAPYVYSSTTRRCVHYHAYAKREPEILDIPDCNRECLSGFISVSVPRYPVNFIIKGNTHFYHNGRIPDRATLERLNVDRIIITPDFAIRKQCGTEDKK